MWEGGVKGPAFVRYPASISPGRWDGLMHTVDFLPSIMEALGQKLESKAGFELDGISMWKSWTTDQRSSPRTDLLLNIDTFRDGWDRPIPSSAGFVRVEGEHQWKLLVGYPGPPDIWKAPPELNASTEGSGDPYVFCNPYCLFDIKSDPREKHDLATA